MWLLPHPSFARNALRTNNEEEHSLIYNSPAMTDGEKLF
jgi:hypothetical protein